MKKRYMTFVLFALPVLTYGQISLNASMAPPVGSAFIYYDANTPSPAFTFSKSGTSNTWDFTAISPLPTQEDTVFIVDPASIPGSGAFPTATHSIRENDDVAFTMININASGATFLGALGDVLGTGTNLAAVVTPPLAALTFPYTYGSSTSGNSNMEIFATGAVIGQPSIDSVRFKSNIVSNNTVIAAGNMIIPSGTFGSLLERQVTTNTDSAWIKGLITFNQWILAPGFPTSNTDSAFYWYSDQSLQKYAHALYDSTGLHDVVFFKSSTVGINEPGATESMAIYPNPVKNMLNVNISLSLFPEYRIRIFDVSGKEVLHGNGNAQKINVSQLIPGIYFLHISKANEKPIVQRFVKD